MKKSLKLIAGIIMLSAVFISCGSKVNVWKDIGSYTYLSEKVKQNISKGKYDLNAFSKDGYTIFTKLMPQLSYSDIDLLIKNGADIDLADQNGNIPLFVAMGCDSSIADKVISVVKEINVTDSAGRNVIAYLPVSEKGYNLLLKMFERGIDVSVYDSEKDVWPFLNFFSFSEGDANFIKFVLSDNFRMCTEKNAFNGFGSEMETMIKSIVNKPDIMSEPFEAVYDSYTDSKSGPIPLVPYLQNFNYDPTEKEGHYMMCSYTSDGVELSAGEEIIITGFAEQERIIINEIESFNYQAKTMKGKKFTVPGLYVSMYASFKDIDGDGINEGILSNIAIGGDREEDDERHPFYYFIGASNLNTYFENIVFTKNGRAYKIDSSEIGEGKAYLYYLRFADGAILKECPVLTSIRDYGPFHECKAFFYLYGNKLKYILNYTIHSEYDDGEEPVVDNFYKYEVLFDTDNVYSIEFTMKKRIEPDEPDWNAKPYLTPYYKSYKMVKPFVWVETRLISDHEKNG